MELSWLHLVKALSPVSSTTEKSISTAQGTDPGDTGRPSVQITLMWNCYGERSRLCISVRMEVGSKQSAYATVRMEVGSEVQEGSRSYQHCSTFQRGQFSTLEEASSPRASSTWQGFPYGFLIASSTGSESQFSYRTRTSISIRCPTSS